MRRLIILAGLTAAIGLPAVMAAPAVGTAATSECSGQDCPPPAGSGHQCERKRQEPTTS